MANNKKKKKKAPASYSHQTTSRWVPIRRQYLTQIPVFFPFFFSLSRVFGDERAAGRPIDATVARAAPDPPFLQPLIWSSEGRIPGWVSAGTSESFLYVNVEKKKGEREREMKLPHRSHPQGYFSKSSRWAASLSRPALSDDVCGRKKGRVNMRLNGGREQKTRLLTAALFTLIALF